MYDIQIYTDGSSAKNRSGWGYLMVYGGNILGSESGTQDGATNQQMELTAAINACERANNFLLRTQEFSDSHFTIYSDSAYLCNCYKDRWYLSWQNNGWQNSKKEPVANKELWEKLIPYFTNTNFTFEKVKGHGNNLFNNIADKLATTGKI